MKPVLRGRDIARYHANWAGLWLIDTHNGYDGKTPIDVNDYPAVKAHLDKFIRRLELRQDQGVTPYNLRNCAYYEVFKGPKLLWKDMTDQGSFAYSETEIYTNDKAYMMNGEHLKYLCAALNCSAVSWLVAKIALTTGMGLIQWKKFVVEQIPIVRPDEQTLQLIGDKVTRLTASLDAGDHQKALEIQAEIDSDVCELNGLSGRQIKALRGAKLPF